MRFSVVIPCFNQGAFLGECLESVRRQRLPAAEVIVVDDGSTDPFTIARIDELCVAPVKLVRQANGGLSAARNAGVAAATGDWILPLDADDQLTDDAVAVYAEAIRRDPSIDIWYPDIEQFGLQHEVLKQAEFDPWRLLWNNHLVCSSAIRRGVFAAGVRYNERMRGGYEDWEFYIHACCEAGFRARRLGRPVFRYRRWGYSMITATEERSAQVIAQLRHGRPIYSDPERLDALKRQWGPFFAIGAGTSAIGPLLAEQTFQDLRLVDDTGAVLRDGGLALFQNAPGAHLLVSLDDTAFANALRTDRCLLEKLALSLCARAPALTWLIEDAGLLAGAETAGGRPVAVVAPLQLFLERRALRADAGGLVARLTDHAAAIQAPVRTLGIGGEHRPPAAAPPETGARALKKRVLNSGRKLSRRARGWMGPERHDRLWSNPVMKTLLWFVDRPAVAGRKPGPAVGVEPGPTPLELAPADDHRLQLIAADPPRFTEVHEPSLLLAVPRLDATHTRLAVELAAAVPMLRTLVLAAGSARVDEPSALSLVAGTLSLADLAGADPGAALAELVRRNAVDTFVIVDAREAFACLPRLARLERRPRVVAHLRDAGPGTLAAEIAARYNNLIDIYVVPSAAEADALSAQSYVSPSKIRLSGTSCDEQVSALILQAKLSPAAVRRATRQREQSR